MCFRFDTAPAFGRRTDRGQKSYISFARQQCVAVLSGGGAGEASATKSYASGLEGSIFLADLRTYAQQHQGPQDPILGQGETRTVAAMIRGLPPDWKWPLGRPSHTWLRAVEADLGQQNIGLASAWRKAAIHDDWRRIVDTATLQQSML